MAKLEIKKGTTSKTIRVFISDSSATNGIGLSGLVFNSAGLTCYYYRFDDSSATVVNLVTATLGVYTSGGFKEIDATNMKGWYEFGAPNASLASGADDVAFHFKGATNMAPLPLEIQLVDNTAKDIFDNLPTNFVDLAITASTGKVTIGTNDDKSNYTLSNAGIDAILNRPISNLDTGGGVFRSAYGAISKLVNKFDTTSNVGKATVFKTDDSTELATQTITSDATAEPITGVDTD